MNTLMRSLMVGQGKRVKNVTLWIMNIIEYCFLIILIFLCVKHQLINQPSQDHWNSFPTLKTVQIFSHNLVYYYLFADHKQLYRSGKMFRAGSWRTACYSIQLKRKQFFPEPARSGRRLTQQLESTSRVRTLHSVRPSSCWVSHSTKI